MNRTNPQVENYRTLAATIAADYGLPIGLVLSIVQAESGGDPWAYNPEPKYRYLWDVANERPFRKLTEAERMSETPPRDFACLAGDRDQEWWGQQASWGLMQVMGAVARELRCSAPFLTMLCSPAIGLTYGCRHLAVCMKLHKQKYGIPGAIAAYNAGSPQLLENGKFANQYYVDKVMSGLRVYG